jgi:hypothetical protein
MRVTLPPPGFSARAAALSPPNRGAGRNFEPKSLVYCKPSGKLDLERIGVTLPPSVFGKVVLVDL